MERPSGGFRFGVRASHRHRRSHHQRTNENNDNEYFMLSDSNIDDTDDDDDDDDDEQQRQNTNNDSSIHSKVPISSEFESAIRNLRPSAVNLNKIRNNANRAQPKAERTQSNINNEHNEMLTNCNELKQVENLCDAQQSCPWMSKTNINHDKSTAFIRHDRVGQCGKDFDARQSIMFSPVRISVHVRVNRTIDAARSIDNDATRRRFDTADSRRCVCWLMPIGFGIFLIENNIAEGEQQQFDSCSLSDLVASE
jgi:hypothetical protein